MFHKITDSRFLYHALDYAPRLMEASPIGEYNTRTMDGYFDILSSLQPYLEQTPTKKFYDFDNLVSRIYLETKQRRPYMDIVLSRKYDKCIIYHLSLTKPKTACYYMLNISEL